MPMPKQESGHKITCSAWSPCRLAKRNIDVSRKHRAKHPVTDCLPHKPSRGKKIDIGRAFGGEHVRVSPSMDMVTAQNPSYLPTVIDQDLSVSSEPIPSDISLRICTKIRESKKCPARGWSCWALNGQGSGMKTILHLICILKALQESGSSIPVQYLLNK